MLGLWIGTLAMAQPHFADLDRHWIGASVRPPGAAVYESQQVVVLGIHPTKPWVAYRQLVRLALGAPHYPHDCAYRGLDEGVVGILLGIYDAARGQNLYAWWTHAPAQDSSVCVSEELSARRLAEAEATFADLGIDTSAPPAPQTLDAIGFVAKPSQTTRLTPVPGAKRTTLALWKGDRELYVREYADVPPEYHNLSFGHAYAMGERHVVLDCVLEGGVDRWRATQCTFTPPLP